MLLISKEGLLFEVEELPKVGCLSLINTKYNTGFEYDLLDTIFNNNIPRDVDKLVEYIPIIESLCLEDLAIRCYNVLFTLDNETHLIDGVKYVYATPSLYMTLPIRYIKCNDHNKLLIHACIYNRIDIVESVAHLVVDKKKDFIEYAILNDNVNIAKLLHNMGYPIPDDIQLTYNGNNTDTYLWLLETLDISAVLTNKIIKKDLVDVFKLKYNRSNSPLYYYIDIVMFNNHIGPNIMRYILDNINIDNVDNTLIKHIITYYLFLGKKDILNILDENTKDMSIETIKKLTHLNSIALISYVANNYSIEFLDEVLAHFNMSISSYPNFIHNTYKCGKKELIERCDKNSYTDGMFLYMCSKNYIDTARYMYSVKPSLKEYSGTKLNKSNVDTLRFVIEELGIKFKLDCYKVHDIECAKYLLSRGYNKEELYLAACRNHNIEAAKYLHVPNLCDTMDLILSEYYY